jgi:hypothetical protein
MNGAARVAAGGPRVIEAGWIPAYQTQTLQQNSFRTTLRLVNGNRVPVEALLDEPTLNLINTILNIFTSVRVRNDGIAFANTLNIIIDALIIHGYAQRDTVSNMPSFADMIAVGVQYNEQRGGVDFRLETVNVAIPMPVEEPARVHGNENWGIFTINRTQNQSTRSGNNRRYWGQAGEYAWEIWGGQYGTPVYYAWWHHLGYMHNKPTFLDENGNRIRIFNRDDDGNHNYVNSTNDLSNTTITFLNGETFTARRGRTDNGTRTAGGQPFDSGGVRASGAVDVGHPVRWNANAQGVHERIPLSNITFYLEIPRTVITLQFGVR